MSLLVWTFLDTTYDLRLGGAIPAVTYMCEAFTRHVMLCSTENGGYHGTSLDLNADPLAFDLMSTSGMLRPVSTEY